jgi:hypothetical protein
MHCAIVAVIINIDALSRPDSIGMFRNCSSRVRSAAVTESLMWFYGVLQTDMPGSLKALSSSAKNSSVPEIKPQIARFYFFTTDNISFRATVGAIYIRVA